MGYDLPKNIGELMEWGLRHDTATKNSIKHGKVAAKRVLKNDRYNDKMQFANFLGAFHKEIWDSDADDECAMLTLEWAFENMFYERIKPYIELFDKLYQELKELGHVNKKTALTYSDIDGALWVESSENKKILIMESYCTMRDDNFLIFIRGESVFHARRAWPRETKRYGSIDKLSVNSYRKNKWGVKYGDARDKGYCFTFCGIFHKVDNVLFNIADVHNALRDLRYIENILEYERKRKQWDGHQEAV